LTDLSFTLIKTTNETTHELHGETIIEGTTIHLILKVRKGENDPDQGIEIIQETLRIIDLQTTVMVATMTETNVLTITRVDFTTLEADGSLESMIGMTVFLAKIVTEDQVKSSKTVDSVTKEATTHLE
jgi:hypothetical protein